MQLPVTTSRPAGEGLALLSHDTAKRFWLLRLGIRRTWNFDVEPQMRIDRLRSNRIKLVNRRSIAKGDEWIKNTCYLSQHS